MKIYTKKGDFGETGILTGKRILKSHPLIEALGTIDEAVASLGLVHALMTEKAMSSEAKTMEKIEKVLFSLGSFIAREAKRDTDWPKDLTEELEKAIDNYATELPQLRNFILPGGNLMAAHIHQARAQVRKMERRLMPLLKKHTPRHPALSYINRLSDYLFELGRWVSFKAKTPEILVHPNKIFHD